MSFRVDGQAMATSFRAHHNPSVEQMESSVDINELKRRIERRDNENKRKDREIALLQKEILTLTKDIHGLRERNDQLQHSLTNARLLTATSREEAETRITNNIIVDLENKLARSEKSNSELMGDNEVHKITVSGLHDQIHSAVAEVGVKNDEIITLKEELYTANLKLKTLQIRLNEKDVEVEDLTKDVEDTKRTARSLKGEIEHKKTQLNTNERTIAEVTAELKRVQAAMLVKNETNSLLRNQVTDMGDKTLNLTPDDVANFKKIEMDNRNLEKRNKELLKSVELHMDLLQRAEAENKSHMISKDELVEENKTLKETIALNTQNQNTSATTFAALKKEVVKLRKENRHFSEKIDGFLSKERDGNTMTVSDPNRLKAGMTNLTRNHQETIEGKSEERKRRKVAEEAAKALRNRISFLLEQMDQASKLSATWKEQKSILKAEINSLHQANYDLRERLLNVQRNFMDKTLYEFANPTNRRNAKTAFLTEQGDANTMMESNVETTERLLSSISHGHDRSVNAAEAAFNGVAARPLPNTVEGLVERQLFDALCGYCTGDRSLFDIDNGSKKSKKKTELKDSFVPKMREDGIVHVAIVRNNREAGDDTRRTDADELLTGLQIPAFLKFVQTRHPDKIPYMFTEKIAAILNFFRGTVQDYLSQLGESRMVGAKLQSKISNSNERVKSMQHMYSLERISKQKNLMKYIREQLRLSDFRRVIDKISKIGRDSLDEIDLQRKELLAVSQPSVNQSLPDNNRVRALMVQLMKVAEQLSATALYNGQDDTTTNNDDVPVGSLELRIPDSQVDDETLHGVVGLLVGALGPTNGQDEENLREGVGRMDAFKQSDVMMGDGLGVDLTGTRLSAATQIAKTFLTVQSNYSDRILLLNLKDNLLSDISCKILSGLVEKSKSLRMLDLRGNMISQVGAKMLFDACRRNQSILYVTQRQNGFMIEGHREIMGSVQQREHRDVHNEHKVQDGENETEEEFAIHKSAKNTVRDMEKRHPLRIDLRNNNPEQEAIEKLLESNEYTSRTGIREKYHNDLVNDVHQRKTKSAAHHERSQHRIDGSSRVTSHQNRPKSAAMSSSAASGRLSAAGISHYTDSQDRGREMNSAPSATNFKSQSADISKLKGSGQLLPQVGDSDDSDEDVFKTEEKLPRDPTTMTEIEKRLAAKENERIIGIRTRDGGAGVGSLLDKEIRHMQERNSDSKDFAKKDFNGKTSNKKRASSRDSSSSRPKSASTRNRTVSANGVRKSQSFRKSTNNLTKSSSEGNNVKRKAKTPQKSMSATLDAPSTGTKSLNNMNNSNNNAYFHLNPAVLF